MDYKKLSNEELWGMVHDHFARLIRSLCQVGGNHQAICPARDAALELARRLEPQGFGAKPEEKLQSDEPMGAGAPQGEGMEPPRGRWKVMTKGYHYPSEMCKVKSGGMVHGEDWDALAQSNAQLKQRLAEKGDETMRAEASPGLLVSMAIRYDHSLGLPQNADRLRETMVTMRQLHEEVIGRGFYSPEKEQSYADRLNKGGTQ